MTQNFDKTLNEIHLNAKCHPKVTTKGEIWSRSLKGTLGDERLCNGSSNERTPRGNEEQREGTSKLFMVHFDFNQEFAHLHFPPLRLPLLRLILATGRFPNETKTKIRYLIGQRYQNKTPF